MNRREFHNALRLLRSIDRFDLPRSRWAGAEHNVRWVRFRDAPHDFFISCSDELCDDIWWAMRQRGLKGASND